MPQTNQFLPAITPSKVAAPLNEDIAGALRSTTTPMNTSLGITAATVVKAAPGRVGKAQVIVGGSTAGGIYDCLTTAQISASNQLAALPALTTAAISSIAVDMIAKVGITVIPGTGQTLAISYE